MPYALPEKQREYQRKWLREKSARTKPAITEPRKGTVTWDELNGLTKYDSIATYNQCVKEAKSILYTRKINRLAVAALAIRSCVIKHGGDKRSLKFRSTLFNATAKKFAEEVGISDSTLLDWIEVKLKIFDRLTDHSKPFDFTSAQFAVKIKRKRPDIFDTYQKISSSQSERSALHAIKHSKSVLTAVRTGRPAMKKIDMLEISINLKAALRLLH